MIERRRLTSPLVVLACAGALAVLPGCQATLSDGEPPQPGTYYQTTPFHYRMSTRTYLLHVPPQCDNRQALPLVLVLHGAFSTAQKMEKRTGFSVLADREGFVVAYPNGIGLFGFLQHWNAGHCCGLAQMDRVDDVGFLTCVIEDVSRRLPIDPQRVYVVGHSNGGMLAYQFASEKCALVAGVGIISGSLGSSKGKNQPVCQTEPPKIPVPLIAIHGRKDRSVPFAGGPVRWGHQRYISVLDSVRSWANYCGCEAVPHANDEPQAGRRTITWQDRDGDAWTVLHILNNWAHDWPGTSTTKRRPPEDPLRTFDAAQVVWDFFHNGVPAQAGNDGGAVSQGIAR